MLDGAWQKLQQAAERKDGLFQRQSNAPPSTCPHMVGGAYPLAWGREDQPRSPVQLGESRVDFGASWSFVFM